MEVALRGKQTGGWWRGLGQSGETDYEGSYIPGDIDFSSGEVDPSTYYPAPGYNINPDLIPGATLSAEELAAEQGRARDWLTNLPNILNTATKVALTASQVTAGLKTGAIKPSTTCPSGYLASGGQCVAVTSAPASSAALIPGVSNTALLAIGGGFLFLMLLSKSGGRR